MLRMVQMKQINTGRITMKRSDLHGPSAKCQRSAPSCSGSSWFTELAFDWNRLVLTMSDWCSELAVIAVCRVDLAATADRFDFPISQKNTFFPEGCVVLRGRGNSKGEPSGMW